VVSALKIIGLTGGIGSGKSTVAHFLEELGAVVIDLDKVGHEALKRGGRAWRQVVDAFGKVILGPEGEIDRTRLGKIVFKDRRSLLKLNNIVHPAIDAILAEKIDTYRREDVKVVVLEAAAMIESGKTAQAEELWVTTAPETTVLERLKTRPGYNVEKSRDRIQAQLSNEERIKKADVVINTDCTLSELKTRVAEEWQKLQKRLTV
jgi:dephospho-CoA kinase